MLKKLHSKDAPNAVGPYSQAIQFENIVFLSGQIAIDPKTNVLIDAPIEDQVHQIMSNIKAVLAEANLDFSNITKTSIFVTNMEDYPKVNEVYASYLNEPYPARETVGVNQLPAGAQVEITVTAVI